MTVAMEVSADGTQEVGLVEVREALRALARERGAAESRGAGGGGPQDRSPLCRAGRLPAHAVLPQVSGLKGPLSCLNEARYGIVWGAMGAARASLHAAQRRGRTHPVR